MLDLVTEQVQRHQRVHPGRLDAAPAAVPLLPGDDPLRTAPQRGASHRAAPSRAQARSRFVCSFGGYSTRNCRHIRGDQMEELVEGGEGAGPGVVKRLARRNAGLQLVDGERERTGRAERLDHGERDDGLPRPAAPVVDVEREPGRQVDQLGRDDRQVVPRPQAGKRQPDPGEHAGRLDPALADDPVAGQLHVRRVRIVAGQPQRQVSLHGGGQVARAAVEVGPGAVVPLLGPDPACRRRDHRVVVQAEELAQQQIFRVHGHVGLELALPPPVGMLKAERVVTRSFQGVAASLQDRRIYHWRAVMNSAIAVSSARTSVARSMSARLALAAAS